MNKKICLLTDSLGSGGAEKMVSNLSISLSKNGYNVTVVSMMDAIVYPYKGTLYNFGKIKTNNKLKSFLKFKAFFKTQQFDVILDHRVRVNFFKEFIFSKVVFKNQKIIYCFHNDSQYSPCMSLPWFSRCTFVKNREIIVVSKGIQNKIKQQLRLESQVIYNYALINKFEALNELDISNNSNYIIGVGRLIKIKQFDVLIKSYKNSELHKHGIKLLILGEGVEKRNLNELITDLNLNAFVKLMGFKSNALAYIQKAKALVLTSKSEGFPMVLIEALSLKTPVISFDCHSGPAEIIKHEENGLLVANQNIDMLTESLNKLLLNDTFYNKIKSNLNHSSNPFSEENNIQKWIDLLKKFN